MITDEVLLDEIKTRLCITGNFHDNLLLAYAKDVKKYMWLGGIPSVVANSKLAVGVIARGVSDMWNFGNGDGKFSDMFYDRVFQLSLTDWRNITTDENGEPITFDEITEEEIDELTRCLND